MFLNALTENDLEALADTVDLLSPYDNLYSAIAEKFLDIGLNANATRDGNFSEKGCILLATIDDDQHFVTSEGGLPLNQQILVQTYPAHIENVTAGVQPTYCYVNLEDVCHAYRNPAERR